jgi:hypothetical protein
MPWVRFDDTFAGDDRVLELPADNPLALFFLSVIWSSNQLKDGWVSAAYVKTRASDGDAHMAALVRVGLAIECDRDGRRGWQLAPDVIALQPTKEQVEQTRAASRDRQAKSRKKKRDRKARRQADRDRYASVTRDNAIDLVVALQADVDDASRAGHSCVTRDSTVTVTPLSQCPDPTRPDPVGADQDPLAGARHTLADVVTAGQVRSHLRRAAHDALEARPDLSDGDLAEAIKLAAAHLRVGDYGGAVVTSIINAVRGERDRRRA